MVDIIDIRYWHYHEKGVWAPEAGKNMAPRQWMRKFPVGKTGGNEAYMAVREYRDRYPEKAVTFYSQQYPQYGWAVLMGGGSLANVKIANEQLRRDLTMMRPMDGKDCRLMGNQACGYLIYTTGGNPSITLAPGTYAVYTVDEQTGEVKISMKSVKIASVYAPKHSIEWLQRR